MGDCEGDKGTSSAITDKRQSSRGGGCVGILFQLFDWHRRFAKKQLFGRKLLPPPAAAKQAAKKFKGDEKMPISKLNLIADENKGGFPSMRKNGSRNVNTEHKHGTQVPGLIARLMGLETMPLVHQKVKRIPSSEAYNDKREKLVIKGRAMRKEDPNEEKGDMKQVLRPSKLHKSEELDGRVASLFVGEALQIKNVLARSRKHHHHKLVTPPVKSPRITPSNNVSRTSFRLIDAAAKILEPGLQNKRRAKCALPYSSCSQPATDEFKMTERFPSASANLQRHAVASENLASKHSMVQLSCKTCSNLLDIMDCGPTMKEEICNHASISSRHLHDLSLDSQKLARTVVVPQKTIFFTGRQQESLMTDSQSERQDGRQIKYAKPFKDSCGGWPNDGQKYNLLGEEMVVEERTMPGSKNGSLKGGSASQSLRVTSTSDKDFVALNCSMSSRTHPKSPIKADCSETDVTRRTHRRRSESLPEVKPPFQKMRSSFEHPASAISLLAKQKNGSGLPGKGNRARCSENNNDVVSFTFKSAVNCKAEYSNEGKNKRQGSNGFNRKTCLESKSVPDENLNNGLKQKHFALSGDALGAFLEETLKELTSQEEEATTSCKMSITSAGILQELIAAVTEDSFSQYGATADSKKDFQMKSSIHSAAKVLPDANSLSPGSVLEASFSKDSCMSSNCDDVSGSKLNARLVDYSVESLQSIVQDVELLDSANSLYKGGRHFTELTCLVGHVASMMDRLILADGRLVGSKVNLVKDIIVNAELLFTSFSPENSNCLENVILTLVRAESADVKALFGSRGAEVGSDMKAFTLDCLLDFFDEGYSRYCNFGYKGWVTLLSSWSPEMLKLDFLKEVRRWTGLSGLTLDEIIEHDMSYLKGKWTDFDVEAFELGAAFADNMLADVVEEITASILGLVR